MKKIISFLLIALIYQGCYSFKGFSIDYTKISTFSLEQFENNARSVVPTLAQDLTEALRLKILNETRLSDANVNGDINFSGEIIGYDIQPIAPEPGETTTFNRLTVTVNVDYEDISNENNSWKGRFSWFQDYTADQNLVDIQDGLIETINKQLVEDIVNKAFSNW